MSDLASFIYGPEAGPHLADRIRQLLAEREARFRNSAPMPFSQRDALLITYADMLSGGGETKPIDRLAAFLSGHARGLFTYVHLLPFFPYSSDDGFSVVDYRAVDGRIGDWAGIGRLGARFKLAFDLVLNHGSVRSEWFKAFLEGKPPYASWYLTRPEGYDASKVFRPRTHPLLTPFTRPDGSIVQVWTTFSADQADFDFGNPEVLLEFVRVLLDYAGRGARLLRLDAIAYLWKEDGTACLHHPKTHAAVKLLRSVVDALGLDLVILTETNVPHEENLSYFGDGDEARMVYNFALPPLLLHAAVSGDAGPLRRWVASLPPAGSGPVFLNFTASHDGIGVSPVRGLVDAAAFAKTIAETERRGGKVSFKSTTVGQVPYELNCVYLDAVAPPDADDRTRARAFLATQAAMLALAGLPAVYFHSWIGSGNWTEGPALLGHKRAINREKPEIAALEADLADPSSLRAAVHAGFRRLLEYRSERAAFSPEISQRVLPAEGAVFALVRGPDARGVSVLCAHNLGARSASLRLPADFGAGRLDLEPWETRWMASSNGGELCI
ncbi:MAG TPA: sugar phosphorylase [Treponema sp.]|nr:sugar phosphorylase [Treponema sp.]